jgi:hypothetical protein
MSQGLQVFNSSGNLILDTGTRVFKALGEFSCSPDLPKTYHDDNIKGKKIALFLKKIDVITDGCNFANTFPVRMTINNQTGDITWDYMTMSHINSFVPPDTRYNTTYIYGWYA